MKVYNLYDANADSWNGVATHLGTFGSIEQCERWLDENRSSPERGRWWNSMERSCSEYVGACGKQVWNRTYYYITEIEVTPTSSEITQTDGPASRYPPRTCGLQKETDT